MNSKALSSVLNYRIVIILIETILIYFLYDKYRIDIKIDFTIMSIAIVFPLVFSITSAYQRRQEAIALFSEFRNKIIDLTNIFYAVDEVNKKDYVSLFNKLVLVQADLNNYLISTSSDNDFGVIREKRKEVLLFIDSHKKLFNEREKDSLIRVKNELFLSAEQIRGIKIHGTPISLRKYCLIFIYFSPLLYNSQLIETSSGTGFQLESIVSLMFSLVVSFVLMALYNVQDYIENPFDQKGLDDLNIEAMKVNDWESLYTGEDN
jgi:predicted membrane chloride channel (bestrophin family)